MHEDIRVPWESWSIRSPHTRKIPSSSLGGTTVTCFCSPFSFGLFFFARKHFADQVATSQSLLQSRDDPPAHGWIKWRVAWARGPLSHKACCRSAQQTCLNLAHWHFKLLSATRFSRTEAFSRESVYTEPTLCQSSRRARAHRRAGACCGPSGRVFRVDSGRRRGRAQTLPDSDPYLQLELDTWLAVPGTGKK